MKGSARILVWATLRQAQTKLMRSDRYEAVFRPERNAERLEAMFCFC